MPLTFQELDASFLPGKSRIRYFSPLYGSALLLSAVACVILFVGYLGIVVGILFACWWGGNVVVLWTFSGVYGIKIRIALLVIALMVGLSMIKVAWSMVRVLFLRPPNDRIEVEITDSSEPVLFHLIKQVAKRVGSKPPTRVFLTGGIAASASRGNCFRAIIGGTRELRLGMSLFPALSVDSIGGIIAHECGHFSQFLGTRLRTIVLAVGDCFVRSREAIECQSLLESNSEESGFVEQINVVCYAIIKRILSIFAWMAAAIASFCSRQMEYSADTYEIAFAGSEKFVETSLTLENLDHVYKKTLGESAMMFRAGKLPENLPEFIQKRLINLTEQERALINTRIKNDEVRLFSSHPTTKLRVASAQRRPKPGLFKCDARGTDLFQDFSERARFLTFHFYDIECGIQVFPEDLVPVDTFAVESSQLAEVIARQSHHYQTSARLLLPVPVESSQFRWLRESFSDLLTRLQNWELAADKHESQLESASDDLQALLREQFRWSLIDSLLLRGMAFPGELSAEGKTSRQIIDGHLDRIKNARKALHLGIEPIQRKRVEYAYLILNILSRSELLPNGQEQREQVFREYTNLLKTLEAIHRSRAAVSELHQCWEMLALLSFFPSNYGYTTFGARVAARSAETRKVIEGNLSGVAALTSRSEHTTNLGEMLARNAENPQPTKCPVFAETSAAIAVLSTLGACCKFTGQRLEEIDRNVFRFSQKIGEPVRA